MIGMGILLNISQHASSDARGDDGAAGDECVEGMTAPRIVVAGGGTGGHLYPGIAVAREILRRQPQAQVSFAGTAAWHRVAGDPARRVSSGCTSQRRAEGQVDRVAPARHGIAAAERCGCLAHHLAPPAESGDRRWRLQLRARRHGSRSARYSDAAARAERGARPDEPDSGAGRQCGGGDVRFDARILRQEGICHRQPGSQRVL